MKEIILKILTFGNFDWYYYLYRSNKSFMRLEVFFLIMKWLLIILFVYFFISAINVSICRKIYKKEEKRVMSLVVKKEYHPSSDSIIIVRRIPVFNTQPEEYKVYVKYDDVLNVFYEKELFEQVKEGNMISTVLVTGFDRRGKIVKQWLELAP